jgi:hypothetical protein
MTMLQHLLFIGGLTVIAYLYETYWVKNPDRLQADANLEEAYNILNNKSINHELG